MVPPSLLIQRQQWEENPRAPRQSDESEVSSQSTGHISNFPPSQKHNEIQIALPKHWDTLPSTGDGGGNHHHQIRPKSQNNSNMPGGRSLSLFYKDLSPNIHLCPQTDFQNLPYSCPQSQWNWITTYFTLFGIQKDSVAFVCLKWAGEHGIKWKDEGAIRRMCLSSLFFFAPTSEKSSRYLSSLCYTG